MGVTFIVNENASFRVWFVVITTEQVDLIFLTGRAAT